MNPNPYAPPRSPNRTDVPPQPHSVGQFRYQSPNMLGFAAVGLFALYTGTYWVVALIDVFMAISGTFPDTAIALQKVIIGTTTLIRLGGGLALLFWVHRAAANIFRFARRLSWSPGMCVGWFFVPLANFVMPMRVVGEIAVASEPEGIGSTPASLYLWWLGYVVSVVVALFRNAVRTSGVVAFGGRVFLEFIGVAALSASVVGLLLVVRHIAKGQDALHVEAVARASSS
jgi:hypothetical protein